MIILLGSAGAGKSVQSQLLSRDLNYRWVSTGMLLRAHSDNSLKSTLNQGLLVTDELVIEVLSQAIASYDQPSKVVIDGFPRKASQATWLVDWAEQQGIPIEAVIHLVVSPEVARQRLQQRSREDDTEEAIARRFEEYRKGTEAIVDAFASHNVPILEIDANQSIEDVHHQALEKLGTHIKD